MTFLAPGWLGMGAILATAVVALHLLNRQRLRPLVFPTVRFVPEASVRAVSRTSRPTDLPLLFIRLAVVTLIALALASPAGTPPRRTTVIVLADRSPAADPADVTRVISGMSADTVIGLGNLSVGLVAARRAARQWSDRADSVALVVVSSLSTGLWDAATETLRASWPGWIRVEAARRLEGSTARGAVAVRWPDRDEGSTDTAQAVYAAGAAMVGRFEKTEGRKGGRADGRAVAWFEDGSPAVTEYTVPGGCERVVGFKEPPGDALIRAAGLRLAERLAAPCGHGWTPERYEPADSAMVAGLEGAGGAVAIRGLGDRGAPVAPIPLLLALLVLGAERILRRRTA